MNVTMILCDAAEAANGKLYILGGGWSQLYAPNVPVNMAVAVLIAVPWTRANEKHALRAILVTEDGMPVKIDGNEVALETGFEVGRPPGLNPGTQLDMPMVFNAAGLALDAGGYVWEVYVNGEKAAQTAFRVIDLQQP